MEPLERHERATEPESTSVVDGLWGESLVMLTWSALWGTLGLVLLQVSEFLPALPPGAQDLIGRAPDATTLEGAAVYGSGALTIGGVLKVVSRFRSSSSSSADAPAAAGTVVTTAKGGTPPGIKHDEAAFTLPGFIPLSKGVRKVTHNEVHALELGTVVGFVTTWLFSVGRQNFAIGLTITFIAGALGLKRYKSKAVATVRMEPWYALLSFAAGAAGAYALFLA